MIQSPPNQCERCGDKPGAIGNQPPDNVPLGELKQCDECGRWGCPVCLSEWYCCEMEVGDDQ